MSGAIGPGTRVRCIKAYRGKSLPNNVGDIYTIRSIEPKHCAKHPQPVLFEELHNPICVLHCSGCDADLGKGEPGYDLSRFVPIDDDDTDLEIFRSIDREVFKRGREPVDA